MAMTEMTNGRPGRPSPLCSSDELVRFRLGRWAVGITLLCAAPLILMIFGLSFSTAGTSLSPETVIGLSTGELGEAAHRALRGSFTHTLLEWTAVCAAAIVGILAFVQFRLSREPSLPIIGMALVCAGAMDAFHTLAADRLIEAVADNRNLIPFTWAICRLFNGIILLVGVGMFAFTSQTRATRRGNGFILAVSAGFVVAAYAIIHICATSTELPQTMFHDSTLKRPYDIYPLIPYLLCGLLVFPKYLKRHRSLFATSLMLSLIPQTATQLYMAFGSEMLHDSCFNIAHGLKTVSYAVPVLGLLLEYIQTFRQRARAERSLRQANDELDLRVRKRTAELSESEERTRAIVETAADGFITIDADGLIESMNSAAEQIFGYSAPELIGRNISLLMPDPYHSEHDGYLQNYLRTGEKKIIGTRREVIGLRKDGSKFPMDLGVSDVQLGERRLFTGIVRDITKRKWAEEQLEELHQKVVAASRHAGMAEIATGVLHNVGNVLNSVNVSATVLSDKLRRSKVSSLAKATGMMREHARDLGSFMTDDEKGKKLPAYLDKLAEHLTAEQSSMMGELQELTKNIEHIKKIVSTQQSHAGAYGVVEATSIAEVVDDALTVNATSFERYGIEMVREYADLPPIALDKQSLLQIMVNLIRNAKHAVLDCDCQNKRLTLRIKKSSATQVRIEVIDSGVGITAENLTKIFAHGFTTKEDGHGFGLHSAALGAKEMGGSLTAHSDGPRKGATFTLDLPIEAAEAEVMV